MPDLVMTVTVNAEAEVTKAADLSHWVIRGTFEDDEATVETGTGAVYIRTGNSTKGVPTMFRPEIARELARALIAAADKAEPVDEDPQ